MSRYLQFSGTAVGSLLEETEKQSIKQNFATTKLIVNKEKDSIQTARWMKTKKKRCS